MRCISKKNKLGFTLLEMMLSIAIITIVSGSLVTVMIAIKDSYLTTYNADDSTDYAMLYAQGFENSFLYHVQHKEKGEWHIKNHEYLMCNGKEVFKLDMMKVTQKGTSTDVNKWLIDMDYKWDKDKCMVTYTITVTDNYYNPGVVRCKYSGGFIVPQMIQHGRLKVEGTINATGSTIEYSPS